MLATIITVSSHHRAFAHAIFTAWNALSLPPSLLTPTYPSDFCQDYFPTETFLEMPLQGIPWWSSG